MSDAFDELSKVSGLRKDEIDNIWKGVKENQKRLENCKRPHKFELTGTKSLVRNAICTKCGGTVASQCARWYIDGMKHAFEKAYGEIKRERGEE